MILPIKVRTILEPKSTHLVAVNILCCEISHLAWRFRGASPNSRLAWIFNNIISLGWQGHLETQLLALYSCEAKIWAPQKWQYSEAILRASPGIDSKLKKIRTQICGFLKSWSTIAASQGEKREALAQKEVHTWKTGTDDPNCNFRTGEKIRPLGCPCCINWVLIWDHPYQPDNRHNSHQTTCCQRSNNSKLIHKGQVKHGNHYHWQSKYNQVSNYTESCLSKEDLQDIETRPISSFGTKPKGFNRVADAGLHHQCCDSVCR